MPSYLTTADYAVSILRKEDWVSRHILLDRLKINRNRVYIDAIKRLSPDEALLGEATGIPIGKTIFVAKDIKRKNYKQLTLHKFFKPAPKKSPYIQMAIHDYFRRSS